MVSRTAGRPIFRHNQKQRESPCIYQNHPKPPSAHGDLLSSFLLSPARNFASFFVDTDMQPNSRPKPIFSAIGNPADNKI